MKIGRHLDPGQIPMQLPMEALQRGTRLLNLAAGLLVLVDAVAAVSG